MQSEVTELAAPVAVRMPERRPEAARGFASVIDTVLFLAILAFSAFALLAIALAAPLAIAATAIAGAASALTARTAKRGGWRVAGAA
jgi:hypothetical protein